MLTADSVGVPMNLFLRFLTWSKFMITPAILHGLFMNPSSTVHGPLYLTPTILRSSFVHPSFILRSSFVFSAKLIMQLGSGAIADKRVSNICVSPGNSNTVEMKTPQFETLCSAMDVMFFIWTIILA
jgi:hypothetical protein